MESFPFSCLEFVQPCCSGVVLDPSAWEFLRSGRWAGGGGRGRKRRVDTRLQEWSCGGLSIPGGAGSGSRAGEALRV